MNPRISGLILYIFHTRVDHYVPECTLNLRYQVQVITNYETLTDADRDDSPNDSYRRVNISVTMKSEVHTEDEN